MALEPDELELRAGETLYVVATLDDGWCQGYIKGVPEEVGLFPSNYVRPIKDEPLPVQSAKAVLNSHLPPYRSNQSTQEEVLARKMEIIEAVEPDEIELRGGDIVVVTKEQDDGWSTGYLASNPSHCGLFPSNYAAPLESFGNNKTPEIPPEEDTDDDPHYMRSRVQADSVPNVVEDEPSAAAPTDSPTPLESLVDLPTTSASDGYYDERGFYVTAAGYFDTQGTFFPTATVDATVPNEPAEVVSGTYDAQGNYIVEGGYYDVEGLYHAAGSFVPVEVDSPPETIATAEPVAQDTSPPSVNTYAAAEPSYMPLSPSLDDAICVETSGNVAEGLPVSGPMDNGIKRGSVIQLKRALEKAQAASERAEQARLQAELEMEKELEARRRKIQRQLEEETNAKAIAAQLQAQIESQLQTSLQAQAATTIQRQLRNHAFRQRYTTLQTQHKAAKVLQRTMRTHKYRVRAKRSHDAWRSARQPKPAPKRLGRYHSKVHITAANRIQRATRDYLACKDAKQELRQAKATALKARAPVAVPHHTKARIVKPVADNTLRNSGGSSASLSYTASTGALYQGQIMSPELHPSPSAVVVPLYTTDVAQISQLASLIANSVNLELGRRLAEHDAHLSDLATSMHKLHRVIEKHNVALQKVYEQNDHQQFLTMIEPSPLLKRSVHNSPKRDKPEPTEPRPTPPSPSALPTHMPSPKQHTLLKPLAVSPKLRTVSKPAAVSPKHSSIPKPSPPRLKPVAPSPKLVQPTGSPTKTRLPQLRVAKPAQGLPSAMGKRKEAEPSLLEPFEELVASKGTPPLGIVRDMVLDLFLDGDISSFKHLVMLVLSEVPANVATTLTPHTDRPSCQLAVRLADGDAIPKVDATLLYAPMSKKEQDAAKKAAKKLVKNKIKKLKKAQGQMGPDFYIATDEELDEYFYALPFDSKVGDDGTPFVETKPAPADTPVRKMVALDCEMCKTTKGVELTRISIVDEDHTVLLDEYVVPPNPIVDYCTQYSGITAETLEDCDNTLAMIQEKVLSIIAAETILVGHSIENDLLALRLLHRRLIDTALLYPHPKGPPFRSALRYLTATYLKLQIQTGSDGHCSVEDATCTMKLAQLKVTKGPSFPAISLEAQPRKLVNELAKRKKSALIIDSAAACRSLAGNTAGAIPATTVDKVVSTIRHQLTTGCPPTFTWGRSALPASCTADDVATFAKHIHDDLPPASLLLMLLTPSSGDLKDLHKLRTTRGDPRSSLLWDKTQQAKLDAAATAAHAGVLQLLAKAP
ncbi:exonuclease [Achlya hypogyna]|uniref:Exonuclease n=1 Tax=Achlya hypogyna TaxID=1202772 RepID=A0A1V9YGX0_ACHHY|nr:exonuclease [Achlya hypogyna]